MDVPGKRSKCDAYYEFVNTDVGLCNGVTRTLIDFIYANSSEPPDLPEAVIVKFDKFRGPSISEPISSCVPICRCKSDVNLIYSDMHLKQRFQMNLN